MKSRIIQNTETEIMFYRTK